MSVDSNANKACLSSEIVVYGVMINRSGRVRYDESVLRRIWLAGWRGAERIRKFTRTG